MRSFSPPPPHRTPLPPGWPAPPAAPTCQAAHRYDGRISLGRRLSVPLGSPSGVGGAVCGHPKCGISPPSKVRLVAAHLKGARLRTACKLSCSERLAWGARGWAGKDRRKRGRQRRSDASKQKFLCGVFKHRLNGGRTHCTVVFRMGSQHLSFRTPPSFSLQNHSGPLGQWTDALHFRPIRIVERSREAA